MILLLLGCAATDGAALEDSVDSAVPACNPALSVGTGDRDFQSLEPGDEVPIIYGPQGGWHLWLGLQATGMAPLTTIHAVLTESGSQEVVSETVNRVGLIADEDLACTSSFAGLIAYLDVGALAHDACDTPPELLVGREVCIRMAAEDTDGNVATGDLCVLPVRSDEDPSRMDPGC